MTTRPLRAGLIASILLGAGACTAPEPVEREVAGAISALSDDQCALIETLGNGPFHDQVLARMNDALAGVESDVGLLGLKQLRINGVQSVAFVGCRVHMRIDVTLARTIRRDGEGTIDIEGDLYPARRNVLVDAWNPDGSNLHSEWTTEDLACLRQMDVTNVDLSHLTDLIGEPLFEFVADRTDQACYSVGSMWQDVQSELNNAFGSAAPQVPYEMKPDVNRASPPPYNPPAPGTIGEQCGEACATCVYQDDGHCAQCYWDDLHTTCIPY